MRLATVDQCRHLDRLSEKDFALSGEALMEAAGSLAAREIAQAYYPEIRAGTLGVVCGSGNNGADGLVVARHLHSAGHRKLIVFYYAPETRRSALFKVQMKRVECAGIRLVNLENRDTVRELFGKCKVLVDALFGIGVTQEITGERAHLISAMNAARVPIVALDVPSGLDADRGRSWGPVVRAQMTISFGLAKPGFFVGEGPSVVGRLRVLPIGYPFELLRSSCTSHFAFNEKLARRYLPKRAPTSHKAQHGHCLVLAGRPGFLGAGVLCASSAYRMGAGYVTWASHDNPLSALGELPEVLTASLGDHNLWQGRYSAVAIGPGLGVNSTTADLINHLKEKSLPAVVVDADAITTCVEHQLFPLPSSWVITPHAGELARVLGVDAREIERDRYHYALLAAEKTGCHVLLKGFRSLLAYKKRCMVIMAGNSALAKAGTGDVLTGMIGGLLAQGVSPLPAAATAAYIHGRMADEWVRLGNDRRALLASDLRQQLPELMARLTDGAYV